MNRKHRVRDSLADRLPDEFRRDQTISNLTAKADLILEELDGVVGQMAHMLRSAYGDRP